MAQRLKGQEVEIVMLVDGAPQDNLTCARSLDMTWKLELLQEGYLGETTDRYDMIFHGIGGRIEFHAENTAMLKLVEQMTEKSRRRIPGTRFNIKSTLNFPGGERGRVVISDVEFGELPMSVGSRGDYANFTVEYGASEAKVIMA